ncbi:hypothetical protein MANAM107_20990 [Actinomyces capricornis]|uniref:Zinc transporter permease n=1 Tax=Actinomyces capricornis TaxID=2755559 RepID=A0ABM7UPK4_9ACTO|nr:hypothetical protein MANAM107_20990 [Actinomyces capricornis]
MDTATAHHHGAGDEEHYCDERASQGDAQCGPAALGNRLPAGELQEPGDVEEGVHHGKEDDDGSDD